MSSNVEWLSEKLIDNPDNSGLRFSKSTVRKSGNILKKDDLTDDIRDDAMFVLSNYRASHKASLLYITSILFDESIVVDRTVIVAKRFKRTPSIIKKLKRFSSMDLDRMQDIVGCRAIFSNRKKLEKVKRKLKQKIDFRIKDYIEKPKADGYRGIHLICRCNNGECNQSFFVEVQLRTKIQHSWATAVEIVDLLTKQRLKSNEGEKKWLDFFKIIGDAFEILDNESNEYDFELLKKSIQEIKSMRIHEKFSAFAQSLKFIETYKFDMAVGYHLILIDFEKKEIKVSSYSADNFEQSIKDYLTAERNAVVSKNLLTALVSTESVENLKDAYPNYFLDSEYFLQNISQLETLYKQKKQNIPSFWEKFIKQIANFENTEQRNRNI